MFWNKVELLFKVLEELGGNVISAPTGGNISPINHKKGKLAFKNRHFDPLPFDSAGITVPITDAEVRGVYDGALPQLQSILEVRDSCLVANA